MENNEYVFRRIRGRIVRIKKKNGFSNPPKRKKINKTEAAKGVGIFSGGALSGIFGGSVFSEFGKEKELHQQASKQMFDRAKKIKKQRLLFLKRGPTSFGPSVEKLLMQEKTFRKAAAVRRATGAKIGKAGFALGAGSLAIGGFLSASGARITAEAVKGEKTTFKEEVFTDLGSSASLAGAINEFSLKRGIGRKAARAAIRKILTKGKL